MPTTWLGRRHGFPRLAIGLLIASVVHVPLPQADFHNVRHHDSPGEICPFHDHLLRWHPSADANDDVALLHWHWFVPLEEMGAHSSPHDGHHGAGQGPAMHAQTGEQPTFDWRFDPAYQATDESRLVPERGLSPSVLDLASLDPSNPLPLSSMRRREPSSRSLRAPVSIAPLVRLNC